MWAALDSLVPNIRQTGCTVQCIAGVEQADDIETLLQANKALLTEQAKLQQTFAALRSEHKTLQQVRRICQRLMTDYLPCYSTA